ncbi:hypothetical protein CYMTET_54277 [Cymbomonas tetramitiformis]|uniref:Uncharacterized protein n=1 Tax=Cymbomonas tetramitiformis TaxID=36881 RepID=A0AAE0BGI4_9CHLO|nr:hypothetical protein CYMTET_54277 [Cymbomonas tetramitiformis]
MTDDTADSAASRGRRAGRIRDGQDRDSAIFTVSRSAHDVYDRLEMEMTTDANGVPRQEGTYFDKWPEVGSNLLRYRFCAVDGGYIARIVKCENGANYSVHLDFGCYLNYTDESNYIYKPTDFSDAAVHVRLFKQDFVERWHRAHPEAVGELRWIESVSKNNFLGPRCSRYNAFRHLYFRYLSRNRRRSIPAYLRNYANDMRWMVSFAMMEHLQALRSARGLTTANAMRDDPVSAQDTDRHDHSAHWAAHPRYQEHTWGPFSRAAPLMVATVEETVRRMSDAMNAARLTVAPEVEGIMVHDVRSRVGRSRHRISDRQRMDADDAYGGCFPAVCTFGWKAVRVGRSPLKELVAFRNPPVLKYFFGRRTNTDGGEGPERAARDRQLVYRMSFERIAPAAGSSDRAHEVHDPQERSDRVERATRPRRTLPLRVNENAQRLVSEDAYVTSEMFAESVEEAIPTSGGPLDFIQRNTRRARQVVAGALYTWVGARSHEIAMIRVLMTGASTERNRLGSAIRNRYREHVPTAMARDTFCAPHIAAQFSLSRDGMWQIEGRYFRDAFPPIPPRLCVDSFTEPVPDTTAETVDTAYLEGSLDTLCHVFAANADAAVRNFMKQQGHRLFDDATASEVEWSYVGTEYPVYNPYFTFYEKKRALSPPLFYETRADAVIHARRVGSRGRAADHEGRVVIVEHKMLMEARKATPRVLDINTVRQCLTNAFVYYACVGILPSHCLLVFSTRRADYLDRPLRRQPQLRRTRQRTRSAPQEAVQGENVAYVGLLRVDLTVRYQMRLFQRVMTSPFQNTNDYDAHYMDERHFLLSPHETSVDHEPEHADIHAFGEPPSGNRSHDMPDIFCRDDVRCPEFAITRMCVTMHETHRRLWHSRGEPFADDDDARVRGNRGFVPSRRSIDLALRDPGLRAIGLNYLHERTNEDIVPLLARNHLMRRGGGLRYNLGSSRRATPEAYIHFAVRYNLLDEYRNADDDLLGGIASVRVFGAENDHAGVHGFGLRVRAVEPPSAPSVEPPRRMETRYGATRRAAANAESPRVPQANRYLTSAVAQFDALRAPVTRGQAANAGRQYRREPDENARARGRINKRVMQKAEEMAVEFDQHDALTLFRRILTLKNPANGRPQFAPDDDEPYNPLPKASKSRRARATVFCRSLNRLLNHRVHAAVSALMATPIGHGWFSEIDPNTAHTRAQQFPHMSDRGSWTTFALNLLEADMRGYEGDSLRADRGETTTAHHAIDTAANDIRDHLRGRGPSENRRQIDTTERLSEGEPRNGSPVRNRDDTRRNDPPTSSGAYSLTPNSWPPKQSQSATQSWILNPVLYAAAGSELGRVFPGLPIRSAHEQNLELGAAWTALTASVRSHLFLHATENPVEGLDQPQDGSSDRDVSRWLVAYLHAHDHGHRYYVAAQDQEILFGMHRDNDDNERLLGVYRILLREVDPPVRHPDMRERESREI